LRQKLRIPVQTLLHSKFIYEARKIKYLLKVEQSCFPPQKNQAKRNKAAAAKQQSAQLTGQGDKCEIALIEARVKELTLLDKPVAPAAVPIALCHVPPPPITAPAYMPLTPSSTPPMAQVETKQYKKLNTPPKVEINKTPDNNNMLKQNSTGNSPHTLATPPAGQNLEPFIATPQQV
jgi:hypothetical protein